MERVVLTVIVGTYNRLPLLQRCIEALKAGVHIHHEVIVVDAGSTDGTLEYLSQCPGIRLVRDNSLMGQARSLNQVIKDLNSDFVCWLSDDNIVLDRSLDVAVDILKQDPNIGMVALKVQDVTGPYTGSPYLGAIWESGILNCNQGMLPAKVFRELSGFNEEFGDYGIDADLTTRVLLAGYKVVYTKRIAIHHYRDHDTDNWITKADRQLRLQAARDLYRMKYAALWNGETVLQQAESPDQNISGSDSPSEKPPQFFRLNLQAHRFLADQKTVGRWISTFFQDWFNISRGKFISPLDHFKNLFHSYHLVQQIPESLRMHVQAAQNPLQPNGEDS